MLVEFKGVSQKAEGFRRLFTDEIFDLYLWYDSPDGPLVGFQLCYDLGCDPHSLTSYMGRDSFHNRIDEGEDEGGYKGTPILVSDGFFDRDLVLRRFNESASTLADDIRLLVVRAIEEYRG